MRKYFPVFPSLLIVLSACLNDSIQTNSSRYFNMDSLIEGQIKRLIQLDPQVTKDATLDTEKETISIDLDSSGWENELKVFRESNIDLPAYNGLYTVKIGERDQYSNLLYDEYLAKEPGKLMVKDLKIYYLDIPSKLKKIEIQMGEKNELFQSGRNLRMTFEDRDGEAVLSSYFVEGDQKLKLNKPVDYKVSCTLKF